ncbi:MAG: DegV family EDD domain-containing protein [Candidatus Diapherotrites archaeon]|nr:DegV family EDD domain-containing protein [Candidatus Diapherotrites archaeon]
MVSFRIIVDSTIDFPPDLSVEVVPVHVYAGAVDLLDKRDFTHETLRDVLEKGVPLRTAAPSVKEWMRAVEAQDADSPVLIMTLGSSYSSAVQSARIAARMLAKNGYTIRVFDTETSSVGAGIFVERAVDLAERGAPLDRAYEELEKLLPRARLYLVVTDMESATRSGRIPRIVGKIGRLLDLHPIFHVVDARVHLWRTVRGIDAAVKAMLDVTRGQNNILVGEIGESAPARKIYAALRGTGKNVKLIPADPAIGAHFGWGSFGVAFFEDEQSPQ